MAEHLPRLREPEFVSPDEQALLIGSYFSWLKGQLDAIDPEHIRRAQELATVIGQFNSLPLVPSRMLRVCSPGGPRSVMARTLAELKQDAGEFIAVRELEGELLAFTAECAEPFIRTMQASATDSTHEHMKDMLAQLAGCRSLEECAQLYWGARVTFSKCLIEILDMNKEGPKDPRLTQNVLFDGLISKFLSATIRKILLDMAIWIQAQDSSVEIQFASGPIVLPLLGRFPDARWNVIDRDSLQGTFWLCEQYFHLPWNSPTSAVSFFNNLAILAILIKEYGYARQCLVYANRYVGDQGPHQLNVTNRVLAELDPQAKA